MNFGWDTPRPHMSHQDPMSFYYDPDRTERESQRDNQISGILTENTKFNEIMTDEEIKTQADYLKAMEICKQPDLLDRLKDRYIEFLAAKVEQLEKEVFTLMTTEGTK